MEHFPSHLDASFREARLDFKKEFQGIATDVSRWEFCLDYLSSEMGKVVGRLFAEKYFPRSSRDAAVEMTDGIKTAFLEI